MMWPFLLLLILLSGCNSNPNKQSSSTTDSSATNTPHISSNLDSKSFIVDLDYSGGSSKTNNMKDHIEIEELLGASFPLDLVKEGGYKFGGWTYNDELIVDFEGKIVKNIELHDHIIFKALFYEQTTLLIQYSLYNPNTNELIKTDYSAPQEIGEISVTNNYVWNTEVNLIANLVEGYTFIGWFYEDYCLSTEQNYCYMMWDEDVVIDARYSYSSYQLKVFSYKPSIGQVLIREGNSQTFYEHVEQNKYFSERVTIAATSKTSTRFLGWYDTNGRLVSTNAVYTFNMPNNDYTLEAKWNSFDIIYLLDGATNDSNNLSNYNVDMDEMILLSPYKAGYTFIGWYYCNNKITIIDPKNKTDMIIEARFVPNDNTLYTINHYFQDISNNDYLLTKTE